MSGGSNIAGLRPDTDSAGRAPDLLSPVDQVESVQDGHGDAEPDPLAGRGFTLIATLAVLLAALWIGWAGWYVAPMFSAPLSPFDLLQLIAAICAPVILIVMIGLLLLRTSRAEANRFGATARAMRREAAALERAVSTMQAILEANRVELARQSNELLVLGDRASERLAAVSNAMASEAKSLDLHARLLRETAEATGESLSIVLNSVPRAQAETAAMKDALDAAGLSATERAAALAVQLSQLAERGREADQAAGGAAERLAAHIVRIDAAGEAAGTRVAGVMATMSVAADTVFDRAAQAVEQSRQGITAQGEALLAMIASNQATIDRAGAEGMATLGKRIGEIEASMDRIAAQIAARRDDSDTLFDGLRTSITETEGRFDALVASGLGGSAKLSASVEALDESARQLNATMAQGDATATRAIATAETLLTATEAATRELDETLPEALNRLDRQIADSRAALGKTKPELLSVVMAAEDTSRSVAAMMDGIARQRTDLIALSRVLNDGIETGHARMAGLEETTGAAIEHARRFADDAAPQLVDALLRIRETAKVASDHARATLDSVIPDAATRMERETGDALARAIDTSVTHQLESLGVMAEQAVAAAAAASDRLTAQLTAIAEQTAMVETRLAEAQDARDRGDSDNLARHVSQLIETMNSASIDIARGLSADVPDSQWAAYLKGDRGAFTRRAVRLLDTGQAREVASLYNQNDLFHDQVNRYIHDFEAMLRHVLSLRDGSPLGVTLLSSDMGKLYVALAQAIERLRS